MKFLAISFLLLLSVFGTEKIKPNLDDDAISIVSMDDSLTDKVGENEYVEDDDDASIVDLEKSIIDMKNSQEHVVQNLATTDNVNSENDVNLLDTVQKLDEKVLEIIENGDEDLNLAQHISFVSVDLSTSDVEQVENLVTNNDDMQTNTILEDVEIMENDVLENRTTSNKMTTQNDVVENPDTNNILISQDDDFENRNIRTTEDREEIHNVQASNDLKIPVSLQIPAAKRFFNSTDEIHNVQDSNDLNIPVEMSEFEGEFKKLITILQNIADEKFTGFEDVDYMLEAPQELVKGLFEHENGLLDIKSLHEELEKRVEFENLKRQRIEKLKKSNHISPEVIISADVETFLNELYQDTSMMQIPEEIYVQSPNNLNVAIDIIEIEAPQNHNNQQETIVLPNDITPCINCPGNHVLNQILVEGKKFECDACDKLIDEGNIIYGCRICNFDLCENCYQHNEAPEKQMENVNNITNPENDVPEKQMENVNNITNPENDISQNQNAEHIEHEELVPDHHEHDQIVRPRPSQEEELIQKIRDMLKIWVREVIEQYKRVKSQEERRIEEIFRRASERAREIHQNIKTGSETAQDKIVETYHNEVKPVFEGKRNDEIKEEIRRIGEIIQKETPKVSNVVKDTVKEIGKSEEVKKVVKETEKLVKNVTDVFKNKKNFLKF